MSCEISVYYPLLDVKECLDIPEAARAHGVISFGSDTTVCFGAAPGAGGFVIEPWEAQEYGILPRHCALLWAGGKFRLEFDKRAGVYLNGSRVSAREFCNPFQDGSEVTLRLGFPDSIDGPDPLAPCFIIRRRDATARHQSFLGRLASRFRPIRWGLQFVYHRPYVVLLLPIAVLAAVGIAAYSQIDRRITAALPHGAIPADMGRKIAPSVASVGISCSSEATDETTFHPLGTAWLYERPAADTSAQPTRWLVTNAHVAHEISGRECPQPANTDAWADGSETSTITKKAVALFPPISSGPSVGAEALELEIDNFSVHPLHEKLNSHDFAVAPGAQGQPSLANVYDIAAVQINANDEQKLGARAYLTSDPAARVDEACLKAPRPRSCFQGPSVLPGRPLLVFGYPVENQPYLGQGVAAQPFEFRTTVQSRTNALSRTLPGPSTEAMPALYAFSARSSGGMSGGPVVASDGNGGFFVVGLVFAGTFVSTDLLMRKPEDSLQLGPDDGSGVGETPEPDGSMGLMEKTVRTSISDGAFAADIVSLDLLLDAMIAKSVNTFEAPADQAEWWNYWADRTRSLDQNQKAFGDRTTDAVVCPLIKRGWRLDKSLPAMDGGGIRGEGGERVRIKHDGSRPVLVTAHLVSSAGDEILQLSVVEKNPGEPDKIDTFYGVNNVSFLPSRTVEGEVVIAGPLNGNVQVEVWTTRSKNGTCGGASAS